MPKRVAVPCGKCYACLQRKRNDWAVRLLEESYDSTVTLFVTLTYDDDHIPFDPDTGCQCFSKNDFQQFIKNIRKKFDRFGISIKFFMCSEYGETTHRPHYHCLIFLKGNVNLSLKDCKDLMYPSWNKCDYLRFDVQLAGKGSFFYVAKYCVKGYDIPQDKDYPTFNLMSKGLGKGMITRLNNFFMSDIENNSYVPDGSHKLHIPRYVRDRVYDDEQKKLIRYKNLSRFTFEQEELQTLQDKHNSKIFENSRKHKKL